MYKKFVLLGIMMLCVVVVSSQELNCIVSVNSQQVDQTSKQVFKTLERALNDYINKTKWTNKVYGAQEKINCSMLITINSFDSNNSFS